MEKVRSLAILVLCAACLLMMACQTTGTPNLPPAATESGAKGVSAASPLPVVAETETRAAPSQQPAAVERPVGPSARPATAQRTATRSPGARPAAIPAHKGRAGGTVESAKALYRVITGHEIDGRKVLDSAIAAIIVALLIGAFAAMIAFRRRRLAPSPSRARR
jgi:hypothetical protein